MFQIARAVLSIFTLAGFVTLALGAASWPADAAPDSKRQDRVLLAQKGQKEQKEAATDPNTLKWYRNYDQAVKVAKQSKKWLLVDVYTDWCHWCTKLDEDVYSNPKIQAFLNKSFVCLKADAEKGDGIMIKDKYGVQGYPCTLVLAPNGKLKGQIDGYLPLKDFPTRLVQILQAR